MYKKETESLKTDISRLMEDNLTLGANFKEA
jgi:hypothetical protein